MHIAPKHGKLLLIAYHDPDRFVAFIRYLDESGTVTERTVSPLRYLTADRILVYCLGREAVRTLRLARVLSVRLRFTADVLPPEGIKQLVTHRNRLLKRADKPTETESLSHDGQG